MKKKLLTLCAIVSISAMAIACGDTAAETEEPAVEESAEVAEVDTQTDAADAEVSEEADDAASTDGSGEEGKYSVFTDASDAEVEAYAQKVVDAVLAKDWDSVGDMISYPIGSKEDNNLCNNKEEFVEYAKNTGFDDEYFKSLSDWKVSDLWGNWQGGCIDDGNIWFSGVNDEGFKILTLFDLRMGDATITD
ncbi:hypothetical protein [Butyrivibrio sp. M55]|uniref:hypothetical protein n=1 Tax=Butyrivibrio sp. M55 TaxID=1855323 RepID=UPI0008EF9F15|nr:hypothetical protein [Butyrivibrio sp. M55]SFU31964.1 hypothetical protein SAMN05216540_10150 [Butyrivibrio sp. M55]